MDTEYGDDYDTMGANYANSMSTDFNPWFKNILGWVSDSQVTTVNSSGTYRIYAFDHNNYQSAPGKQLALRFVKDSTYNYWVACRTDFTNNSTLTNGVYVFWGYNYTRQSDLLDMNTPGNSDQDAGLHIGGIFTDVAAANGQGVTIHPLDVGGTPPNEYRDVQIIFGTAPPLAPTFTLNPSSQSGVLGQTVSYAANASGNPAPTYQWQRKPAGSSTWTSLTDNGTYSGSTTTNLTVMVAALAMSGDLYQCIASNSQGSSTSTPPAGLSVSTALTISTVAGQTNNFGSVNATGTNALFAYPWSLVCDAAGNVYVLEYWDGQVRKIAPNGVVSTFASGFYGPQGIAIDGNTNLYVSDTFDNQIARVSPTGTVTVLAGSYGVAGSQDGTNTATTFAGSWGIAVDSLTNVFVVDNNSNIVRKVSRIGASQNWAVTTIAGTAGVTGSNDGTNGQAQFNSPSGLACDPAGNLYVADTQNETLRKITRDATGTNWIVTTIAGQAGYYGSSDGLETNATLAYPTGLASDAAGNIYFTDAATGLIRVLSTNGFVTTLAGSSGATDGFYTAAGFNFPYGIAVDRFGNIYIADTFNYTIRVGHVAQVVTPSLAITAAGHNNVVNWPVPTATYRLQASTNLVPANWINVTNLVLTFTNYNVVTNTVPSKTMYYRLINP